MKPSAAILAGLLLVLAVVSFLFVRIEAGSGGAFVLAQRNAQALTAAGVARVVRTAPDHAGGRPGRHATCTALGHVWLRNPWRCSITYADGNRVQYLVEIHLNGSYTGSHQVVQAQGRTSPGSGRISGCCITVP